MTAYLNDPTQRTGWRQPALQILLDGQPLPGAIEAEVTNNNHYQADRFTASFAITPGSRWFERDTVLLDVQASVDYGAPFVSLIVGEVSGVEVDLLRGHVHVDGRDLASRLIEAKTQETFKNQTASQIAQTLAARHGLASDVSATTTLVGRYYVQDHDHINSGEFSRTTTEWDLLTHLAHEEGFDVWVAGTTLHFKPITLPDSTPWGVQWAVSETGSPDSNVMDLHLTRNLTLARDLIVEVKSWSSKTASGFIKTARAEKPVGKEKEKGKRDEPQKISISRPNLTQDQAQKLANATLAQETQHERVIRWTEPSDPALTARSLALLQGTGTSWDQVYFVSSVQRQISVQSGYVMHVQAKNHSPQSQVTLK